MNGDEKKRKLSDAVVFLRNIVNNTNSVCPIAFLLLFVVFFKKTRQPFRWCAFLFGVRSYSRESFIFAVICYVS